MLICTFTTTICYVSAKPISIFIQNKVDTALIDQPFVLNRNDLKPTDSILLPAVKDEKGNWIPSQVDDINGDGKWDELAFLLTLKKNERVKLKIKWLKPAQYPNFIRRANVRYGKMVLPGKVIELKNDSHGKNNLRGTFGYPYQMDGVAWENDKMGFRHYFDGRNCRDLFGKKTDKMVLDDVGIKPDGFPGDTYHVMAGWGRDIMSVGQSFGLGGLALLKNDSIIRLGVLAEQLTDVIDSTSYTLINKGVVRAIFRLEFEGWNIGNEKISFSQVVTIWGGSYGYDNEISCPELPKNCSFVTGIVHNNNNHPLQSEIFHGQQAMITHDKQSYNKEFTIGMCLLIPTQSFVKSFDTPDKGEGIIYTWCAQLRPQNKNNIKYSVLASWEQQNPAFLDRVLFVKTMEYEALKRSKPVVVVLSDEPKYN